MYLSRAQDDELEAELDRVAQETAELRELPLLDDIDDVLMTRAELLLLMPEIMAEEMEPDEAAAQSRALAALGLLPPGTDLFGLHLRLLGEQAAGFYDPITDEMIVLSDGDLNAEKYFYSHEVIHALQDAYLDPNDLMEDMDGLNEDEALAVIALYEGDAVAGSNDYLASHLPLALALLDEAETEFPELEQAPAAVGVTLLFPYVSGLDFVERLRSEDGWDAVNAAYDDLPASTEQVLHPLKYLVRDVPVDLTLPDPAATLGAGWRVVAEDTLGEFQTSLLLANLDPGEGFNGFSGSIQIPEAARNAAAGWDGDRYALWEDEGSGETLVWRTAWDTPEDARAFSAALAKFGEGRWDTIYEGESGNDVALMTPDLVARISLAGQEVFYVQAPDLPLADAALAALRAAPAPEPAPSPQ